MDRLIKSLKILSALISLTLYQKGGYLSLVPMLLYLTRLLGASCLSADFWRKDDAAVEDLKKLKVLMVKKYLSHLPLPSRFGRIQGSQEDILVSKKKVANDFDLDHFRQLMARDGLSLSG